MKPCAIPYSLTLKHSRVVEKIFPLAAIMLMVAIGGLKAQTLDEICEIDLPVVVINTADNVYPSCEYVEHPEGALGIAVGNATKVPCSVTIRLHEQILYESGEYVKDKSGALIKIRGNTSAYDLQKPYKLKLQKKADLLLRGDHDKYKDKDWLLLRENRLKTFYGFALNDILDMPYKPGFKPVNVFLNNNYVGLYYLAESVERNEKCRIDVDKETGFIAEYDAYWWNEDFYIPLVFQSSSMGFTMKYPKVEDLNEAQKDNVFSWLDEMQRAVLEGRANDYLCLDTCARWVLAQDLLGNSDGAGTNLFLAKMDNTAESKAYVPTLWDFDEIFNSDRVWSQPHIWDEAFFNFLFKCDKSGAFSLSYCKTWISMKDSLVPQKLQQRLTDFANSDEGKAFEKSFNLTHWMYHRTDHYLEIVDQVKTYNDWISERCRWMDMSVDMDFPDEILSLIYKHTISPDEVFDVVGRIVPYSYKGVKIIDGKKFIKIY